MRISLVIVIISRWIHTDSTKSELDVTDESDHVKVKSEGLDKRDVHTTVVFACMEILSSGFSKTEMGVTDQSDSVHINSQAFDQSEVEVLMNLTMCRCAIMDS